MAITRPLHEGRGGTLKNPRVDGEYFAVRGISPHESHPAVLIVAVCEGAAEMAWCVHDVTTMSASALSSAAIGTSGEPPSTQPLWAFFEPRTVAVIGAGRRRGCIGAEIFHNLIAGFRGRTIPINPNAQEVESVRAYRTVNDVECAIDLAIVAVPAYAVAE